MAIIGTFNGASIIVLPTTPACKSIELVKNDTVAMSRSPFTGTTQVQAWPGSDWFEATLNLPQLTEAQVGAWSAFLGECRGMANVFYLSNPAYKRPCGKPKGTPVVDGVNPAMAQTLNTKGWLPNAFRLLMPGDYVQIGYRLHEVLNVVSSDANGKAAISIYPSIREATIDAEPLVLKSPQGLFRLAENKRSVLTDETRLAGISIKVMEAR